jgi:hypothetical protein
LLDRGVVDEDQRPGRRVELRVSGGELGQYEARRALLTIDSETGLLVGARIFDANDRMVGDYAYRELQLDAPLTPVDFDPANPAYAFPRWRVPL